jgi:hypothetical protein
MSYFLAIIFFGLAMLLCLMPFILLYTAVMIVFGSFDKTSKKRRQSKPEVDYAELQRHVQRAMENAQYNYDHGSLRKRD